MIIIILTSFVGTTEKNRKQVWLLAFKKNKSKHTCKRLQNERCLFLSTKENNVRMLKIRNIVLSSRY